MASQLGLHQTVVRLVAESMGGGDTARARKAISIAFRYCLVGTIVVAGALLAGLGERLAITLWKSPLMAASLGAIVAWSAVAAFQILTSETFRGLQDLRLASVFGGVITGSFTMLTLLGVWLVVGKSELEEVIWITAAATALSLALALTVLRRKIEPLDHCSTLTAAEMLSISFPVWITGLATFAMLQIDLWVIGAHLSKEQVGIYFAAVRLVAFVAQPLLLVNLIVPPFIAELYHKGETKWLERVLRNTATIAGLPALLVLAIYVLFAGPILAVVFTEPYRAAATVLTILAVGRTANVLTGSCGVTLIMTGHQSQLMTITLITGGLTVTGILVAVERWGMTGVAAAVACGNILQNTAMWLAARHYTGMWTHASLPDPDVVRGLLRPPRSGS